MRLCWLSLLLVPSIANAQEVPDPPPIADRVPVEARHAAVEVVCPATFEERFVGFAFGDRRTVLAATLTWRCRRELEVRAASGGRYRVASVRGARGVGLMLVELVDALPEDVTPMRFTERTPHEGERLYAVTRGFEYGSELRMMAGHVLEATPELRFRLDTDWGGCPRGSPLIDRAGRLVAVCDADRALREADLAAVLEAGPSAPDATLSGGGGVSGILAIEADGTVGLGLETDFALMLHDEWMLGTSWGLLAHDIDDLGNSRTLRLQHELRVGYRGFLGADVFGATIEVSVGAAVGVDLPGAASRDGVTRFWARPTARVRLVWGPWQLGYAAYFDVEQPGERTTHQILLGVALEP